MGTAGGGGGGAGSSRDNDDNDDFPFPACDPPPLLLVRLSAPVLTRLVDFWVLFVMIVLDDEAVTTDTFEPAPGLFGLGGGGRFGGGGRLGDADVLLV